MNPALVSEFRLPSSGVRGALLCCLAALLVLSNSLAFADTSKPLSAKALAVMAAQASQAFKRENFAQAAQLYRELTVLNAKDALAWQFLGQSLARTNDVIGAQRAFAKVLEIQATGRIADSTREMMANLPDPDLFTMNIETGLTLGDWMPLARDQVRQGNRKAVLEKIKQYLDQFGPVPQLLAYQTKLQQEIVAELKLEDADSATTALPQLRELLLQAPSNLDLLRLEARACHLMKDFKCADAAYSSWLRISIGSSPERKDIVRALMQARQGQAPGNFLDLPKLGLTLQNQFPDQAAGLGLANTGGILVQNTEQDGPAEKAGLKIGDLILKLDGKNVALPIDVQRIAAEISPGSKVLLQFSRVNEVKEVRLTVEEVPAAELAAKAEQAAAAFKANDYLRAIQLFRELVVLNPKDVQSWQLLGQSLAKTNDRMGARRAFVRQLEIEPEGKLADSTRELLAALPEPDLFSLVIHPGLTLGDWMKLATKRIDKGNHEGILVEIQHYLSQFGPVPQLLALQATLQREMQTEHEQRLQIAIDAIKLADAESAATALPRIRQLRVQAVKSLDLLRLEATACHLILDYACAESAYAAWLQTAPGSAPMRDRMVDGLLLANRHEELSVLPPAPRATGEIIRDCHNCPEMVVISKGIFEMGATGSKHTVTFSRPFAIGRTEVTQGQWKEIMGSKPSHFDRCGETCPVENVSWKDVKLYIQKLNARTGQQYRLPSEAEWELACRAGKEQEYCGSDEIGSVAWYGAYAAPSGNSSKTTHPVATRRPNAWGIYDMSGNVSEWVEDIWHESYKGSPSDGSAWTGDGLKHVIRGGSWVSNQLNARASYRDWESAPERTYFIGFRLARTVVPSSAPDVHGLAKRTQE